MKIKVKGHENAVWKQDYRGLAMLAVLYAMSGRDLRTFLSDHRRSNLNSAKNEGSQPNLFIVGVHYLDKFLMGTVSSASCEINL